VATSDEGASTPDAETGRGALLATLMLAAMGYTADQIVIALISGEVELTPTKLSADERQSLFEPDSLHCIRVLGVLPGANSLQKGDGDGHEVIRPERPRDAIAKAAGCKAGGNPQRDPAPRGDEQAEGDEQPERGDRAIFRFRWDAEVPADDSGGGALRFNATGTLTVSSSGRVIGKGSGDLDSSGRCSIGEGGTEHPYDVHQDVTVAVTGTRRGGRLRLDVVPTGAGAPTVAGDDSGCVDLVRDIADGYAELLARLLPPVKIAARDGAEFEHEDVVDVPAEDPGDEPSSFPLIVHLSLSER